MAGASVDIAMVIASGESATREGSVSDVPLGLNAREHK